MGKYFGTDGFRGEVNKKLTAIHAFKIGRFLGWYFGRDGKQVNIVIGKDTRKSGYMLEEALCSGITASGADAYIMHVTPTPSVAYITRMDEFDCGIMISASHNAYYDNGIKLLNAKGEKMEDEVIALIEDHIDGKLVVDGVSYPEIPYALRDKIGKTVDYTSGRNRYIGYLISLGVYSFKDKKIGLDCANGATWAVAKPVFEALGAKVYVINCEPNGTNINLNAGSTHPEGLQQFVLDNGLDVGFAFDGDADRCLAVDEKGNLVNGDQIIYLYARYLNDGKRLYNDEVVTTVMSNLGLYKALDRLGIRYHATPVGDKYVHDYMAKHGNLIGGEQSGHIIFSKYATTGDGMLTALKVVQVMISRQKTLSELVSDCVMYPQVLINVKVTDKRIAQEDEDVKTSIQKVKDALGDSGRILVRGSGTEPLVRVMVEAETSELCQSMAQSVVDVMIAKGYQV